MVHRGGSDEGQGLLSRWELIAIILQNVEVWVEVFCEELSRPRRFTPDRYQRRLSLADSDPLRSGCQRDREMDGATAHRRI